jgi:hypothetical protein
VGRASSGDPGALAGAMPDAPTSEPEATVTLCQPLGQAAPDLIRAAGGRAFPPRRPHQPSSSPVLTEADAV